jgi:leader peptidase (prepilin peptidase) / N-methyltransferase
MTAIFLGALFALGLSAGSFVNVLAIRYLPDGKLFTPDVRRGRSHCMSCGKGLVWYELIPLASFVIQRGKCRSCKAKLSLQYPVIELFSGITVLFAGIYLYRFYMMWQYGARSLLALPVWFYSFVFLWSTALIILILILLIDLKHYIIPDQLNIALVVLGVVNMALEGAYNKFGPIEGSFLGHHALLFGFRDNVFVNHLFGALVGLVFFGLIVALSRGRAMGMGDVKLAGALGLLFGWPDIGLIIVFSYIIGALAAFVIMAKYRKTMKDAVPFGPFITAATFLTFFGGVHILSGYFSLFGII